MSQESVTANTPLYVLHSGNQSIYPTVNFDDPDTNCVCVYGFSDKPFYDKFIKNAGQLLTPYPLVKGYLSNRIAEAKSAETNGIPRRFVVLDAVDLTQPRLFAASMATVLLAHQEKAKKVPVEFELVFNSKTASYSFKSDSEKMPPRTPISIAN